MSTLRISNIEAKANSSSPSIDEKLKFTNSVGDVLVYVDGKTSGITTIGINTTAESLKFDKNNNIYSTGIITATKFSGAFDGTTGSFSGDVSIGGTLTYQDVTNIDSVGIITARSDIRGGRNLNITGLSTFSDGIFIPDNKKVQLGNVAGTADFEIAHDTNNTVLQNRTGALYLKGIGGSGNNIIIEAKNNQNSARFIPDGAVDLYYNNTKRISTSGIGVTVAGTIDLDAISKSISDTAVDIFVYDTSKDSDGGAWRKKTSHTSWYNESSGAKRGTRKEFPAVAVIVLESTQVTIYDGDDPDLPMWMVFDRSSSSGWTPNNGSILGVSYLTYTSISMLNGMFVMGADYSSDNANGVLIKVSFIEDTGYYHGINSISSSYPAGGFGRYNGSIAERNGGDGHSHISDSVKIHNVHVYDVAMTVLPNAPIDVNTGLPIPTIAAATAAGTSIIKDNGTVVDVYTYNHGYVAFDDAYNLIIGRNDGPILYGGPIPAVDIAETSWRAQNDVTYFGDGGNVNVYNSTYDPGDASALTKNAFGYDSTLGGLVKYDLDTNDANSTMVAYATTSSNTGWMVGNTPFCWCADARGNATYSGATSTNLVTNGTFDSNTNGWTAASATLSVSSGKMRILTSSQGYAYTTVTTVVGTQYVMTFDITTDGNANAWVQIGSSTHGTGNPDIVNANPIGENQIGQTVNGNGYNFVAKTTTTYITIKVSTSGSNKDIYIDNVEVVAADRGELGAYSSGLKAIGTVPKSPVATGADLLAYGPFSSSNLLLYPKNHSSYSDYNKLIMRAINFSISGWFNCSDVTPSGDNDFFTFTDGGPTEAIFLQIRTNGTFRFYVKDSNYTAYADTAAILKDNEWFHFVCVRRGREYTTYLNGELEATATAGGAIDVSNGNITIIGGRPQPGTGNYATTTKVALIRPSMSVPSPEQITKMYHDERKLFAPNAKCTLYGSSDAVTALAHDDATDTLHVGTSSGRSEFVGLNRINNTTTAVTAAISASNGLVADE